MSTALTVLAFTVVLAEMFAAIGMSTLAPAAFVEFASLLKLAAAAVAAGPSTGVIAGLPPTELINKLVPMLAKMIPSLPGLPPPPTGTDDPTKYNQALDNLSKILQDMINKTQTLKLLTPKSATIDASFECGGSESLGMNVGAEGVIQVVGVKAGYSAMFELHSSTTIKMHIDFALVEYTI